METQTQTTNVLERIGAWLKASALARPGTPIKREFKNGAVVSLVYENCEMKMRIVRRGLSPQNDFSKNGTARRDAWHREIATFRRAFGVPETALCSEGAQTVFYFAVLVWTLDPAAARGGK